MYILHVQILSDRLTKMIDWLRVVTGSVCSLVEQYMACCLEEAHAASNCTVFIYCLIIVAVWNVSSVVAAQVAHAYCWYCADNSTYLLLFLCHSQHIHVAVTV